MIERKINITYKILLGITILASLFSQIVATIPSAHAVSPLAIAEWTIIGPNKTYEAMFMHITITNNDINDHFFTLSMTTTNGLFKSLGGFIWQDSGLAKAGLNYYVSLILYPTDTGQVELDLSLMTDQQVNNSVFATRTVAIQKGDLETSVDNLQQNYASLNSSLDSSIGFLNSQLNELTSNYNSLETKYDSLLNDSATTRILAYVALALAVLFAGLTLYLATKKRKENVTSTL